jgi:hypothetical protein
MLMQSHAGSCSPEALGRLQKVFDAVWLELEQQKSSHTFPWAIEATRYTIAQLVLQHATNEKDAEHIKSKVLQTLTSDDTMSGK